MCLNLGRITTVKNLILKSILQGNNDKVHYCNLNTLQLNISFKKHLCFQPGGKPVEIWTVGSILIVNQILSNPKKGGKNP